MKMVIVIIVRILIVLIMAFTLLCLRGNNLMDNRKMIQLVLWSISTSFNVMDMYSYKNSPSIDQVKRLRMVLQQCPSLLAYKSDWALREEIDV